MKFEDSILNIKIFLNIPKKNHFLSQNLFFEKKKFGKVSAILKLYIHNHQGNIILH
jgi:hypothetical protein